MINFTGPAQMLRSIIKLWIASFCGFVTKYSYSTYSPIKGFSKCSMIRYYRHDCTKGNYHSCKILSSIIRWSVDNLETFRKMKVKRWFQVEIFAHVTVLQKAICERCTLCFRVIWSFLKGNDGTLTWINTSTM